MDQTIVQKWFADRGDQTLRVNYDLTPESFVVDLGAYKGTWAKTILDKYNCKLAAFEPIPSLYDESRELLASYSNARVYKFGLGVESGTLDISLDDNASSLYTSSNGAKLAVEIRSMASVSTKHFPDEIALMKINIEGGEYDILDWLIAHDEVRRYKNLQIQFHDFFPDAVRRRNRIRKELEKTHTLTYDYEFVWENWKRNI